MVFEDQLPVASHGSCNRFFQQGCAALHHAHPVPGYLHHGAVAVDPCQSGLLRQQHSRGGKLQAGQDLLPELAEVLACSRSRFSFLSRRFGCSRGLRWWRRGSGCVGKAHRWHGC